MPVSGEPGLIPKLTGGSENLRERQSNPVGKCRTARPGSSLIRPPSAPKPGSLRTPDPGPPIALADTLACRGGRPGRILQRRTAVSALHRHRHFVTVPIGATVGARRDRLSRSGQEILT